MRFSLDAFRRVAQHLGLLLLLRADLAAEELSLSVRQWLGWLGLALAAFAFLLLALIAAGAWLTLLLWDRFGVLTLAALGLLFGACSALLLRGLVRAATASPVVLARTRSALREDYEMLSATVAARAEGGSE
jgi:hypothetical protein